MSASINQGFVNERRSNRVLQPPGGASSNIFGADDSSQPAHTSIRSYKQQTDSKSNIFGGSDDAAKTDKQGLKPKDNNIFSPPEPEKKGEVEGKQESTEKKEGEEDEEENKEKEAAAKEEEKNKAAVRHHPAHRGQEVKSACLSRSVDTLMKNINTNNNTVSDSSLATAADAKQDGKWTKTVSCTSQVITPENATYIIGKFKNPITQEFHDGDTDKTEDKKSSTKEPQYGEFFKNPITGEIMENRCLPVRVSRQNLSKETFKNPITGELSEGVFIPNLLQRPQSVQARGLFKNPITNEPQPDAVFPKNGSYMKVSDPEATYVQGELKNPITGELHVGHLEPRRVQSAKSRYAEGQYQNPITQQLGYGQTDAVHRSISTKVHSSAAEGNYVNPITGVMREGREETAHKPCLIFPPNNEKYKDPIAGVLVDGIMLEDEIQGLRRPNRDMIDPIVGLHQQGKEPLPPKRPIASAPYGRGLFKDPVIGEYRPECLPPPRTPKPIRGLKCPITGEQYDGKPLPVEPVKRSKALCPGSPQGCKNTLTGESFDFDNCCESASCEDKPRIDRNRGSYNPITGEDYNTTQKSQIKCRQPPGGASSGLW